MANLSPVGTAQLQGIAPRPIAGKVDVLIPGQGGQLVPYYSPANPNLGVPPTTKALPGAGGSTPPFGVGTRGPELNVDIRRPNPGGRVGNVPPGTPPPPSSGQPPWYKPKPIPKPGTGNPRGGGGLMAAYAVASAADLGLRTGGGIYEGAGDINSNVFKFFDRTPFERFSRKYYNKLKDKIAGTPKTFGGGIIEAAEYPFEGGQTTKDYNIFFPATYNGWAVSNGERYAAQEQDATHTLGGGKRKGPIRNFQWGQLKEPPYTLTYSFEYGVASTYSVTTGMALREYTDFRLIANRADGTSRQDDIAQGGNPDPSRPVTREPINNTVLQPQGDAKPSNIAKPFAEPPPRTINLAPPLSIPEPQVTPPTSEPKPNPAEAGSTGTGSETTTRTGTNATPTTITRPGTINPVGSKSPQPESSTTTNNGGSPSSSSSPPSLSPVPKGSAIPPIPAPAPLPATNTTIKDGTAYRPEEEPRPGNFATPSGGCCVPTPVVRNQQDIIGKVNALGQAADLSLLYVINSKLGNQVPGGLSGYLQRFANSIRLDKALNALNTALLLHNAMMLSRNLGETLGYFINSGLQAIGIKDEEDNPININEMIGGAVENFIKGIVGEDLYNGAVKSWKEANAVYQSIQRIYDATTNMLFGLSEGLTILGEYTGKMGNALKRSGVVLQNSYDWFDEKISFRVKRLGRLANFIQGLESAEEITSNLTEVTESVVEIKDSWGEAKTEVEELRNLASQRVAEKATAEATSKINSQSPDITADDLIKPGGS